MKNHEKAAKQEQLQHYGQTKMYKPQYYGQTKRYNITKATKQQL